MKFFSLFIGGVAMGAFLFTGISAPPAHAALGSDIVCLVFTDLNHIGTPIPFLSAGNCPPNSATSTLPTLTVTKIVSGGSRAVRDFPLFVNGMPVTSGVATTTLPGSYAVTETNTDSHYAGTFSGDCDTSGHITLLANTNKQCTLTNTYTASGGGDGGGTGPYATSTDLSILKTVSTSTPVEGQTITYTLTVHNAGPDAADHVSATDLLPTGLLYISDTGAGGYVSSTGVWTIGVVATTSDKSLQIIARVGSTTATIINTTTVSGANSTDPHTSNNSASVAITPAAPPTTDNGGGDNGNGGDNTNNNNGGGGNTNATTNTGGGGGGGVISGPLSIGYQNGGLVLGTSTEATVTTTTSSCGLYLSDYLRIGSRNNPDQVSKLQMFLNTYAGTKLPVTGFFGKLTDAAVRKFQTQYAVEVLEPWIPYGLQDHETTGYVYKTTQRKINLMMCNTLNIPMPLLP